jgi:hypothetical protein
MKALNIVSSNTIGITKKSSSKIGHHPVRSVEKIPSASPWFCPVCPYSPLAASRSSRSEAASYSRAWKAEKFVLFVSDESQHPVPLEPERTLKYVCGKNLNQAYSQPFSIGSPAKWNCKKNQQERLGGINGF